MESTESGDRGEQAHERFSDRPTRIRAAHLSKLAVVYIRQSSMEQVQKHFGSTASQRDLAGRARRWGWPDSRVTVIDHDLGLSGTSSEHRMGFQWMLERMDAGEVGIVLVHDTSRVSRNTLDGERFLECTTRNAVLVEIDGRVYDPANADVPELLEVRMQFLFAWYDNASRARRLRASKLTKVRMGYAVSPPPIGYVKSAPGKWEKDPDPEVREAIQRVFDLYLRFGSIRKVFKYHHQHGLLFPRRVHGAILWEPISSLQVAHVLRNANHTPDYVYLRLKFAPVDRKGGPWAERRPRAQWLVAPDHHEGYVSGEQWEAVQSMLTANRIKRRPPVLDGPALLQGILWCHCGRFIRTAYHRKVKDGYLPAYVCRAADRFDNRKCFWSPHEILDGPVVPAVLKALTAPSSAELQAVVEESRREWESLQRVRTTQLRQREAIVADLRRRYNAVDPEHRRVMADLEVQLDAAIRALDDLKAEYADHALPGPVGMSPEELSELQARCANVPALWEAPPMTNADRKRLIQTVVARVVVRQATDEWLDLEAEWVGGLRETHHIVRRQGIPTLIKALREEGQYESQIVQTLRSRGLLNREGRLVGRHSVSRRLRRLSLTRQDILRKGYLRIRELVLEGWSIAAIVEELRQNGPQHWQGTWSYPLVREYIRRLRRGEVKGFRPCRPVRRERRRQIRRCYDSWRSGAGRAAPGGRSPTS